MGLTTVHVHVHTKLCMYTITAFEKNYQKFIKGPSRLIAQEGYLYPGQFSLVALAFTYFFYIFLNLSNSAIIISYKHHECMYVIPSIPRPQTPAISICIEQDTSPTYIYPHHPPPPSLLNLYITPKSQNPSWPPIGLGLDSWF